MWVTVSLRSEGEIGSKGKGGVHEGEGGVAGYVQFSLCRVPGQGRSCYVFMF